MMFRNTKHFSLRVASCLYLSLFAACTQVTRDTARLRVTGQAITLAAPPRYCVDRQSADVTRGGGRVLFGDCVLLGLAEATRSPRTAVISASVSNAGLAGTLDQLEAFLTTEPGVLTLGRSGQDGVVRVLDSRQIDNVLLIKVRDDGPATRQGASPLIWRGFFETAGRVVTATINTAADDDIPDKAARRLLLQLAAATRAVNAK